MGAIARWISGFCGLLVFLGILGFIICGANEIFSLGLFEDGYPVLREEEKTGSDVVYDGSFGEYAKQTGIIVAACAVVGSVLWWFFGDEI